jgi:hypothetical protein
MFLTRAQTRRIEVLPGGDLGAPPGEDRLGRGHDRNRTAPFNCSG